MAAKRKLTDESSWRDELKDTENKHHSWEEQGEASSQKGEPEKLGDVVFQEEKEAHEETVRMKTPPKGATIATERSRHMSMIDPSEWNLENATDLTALPDGSEVRFRVLSVRKGSYGDEDAKTEYWMPMLEVIDEPEVKDFSHFLSIPNTRSMSTKQYKSAQFNLKIFLQCIGMSLSQPFNAMEDWPGMEGAAILSMKVSEEYGQQNFIKPKGFLLP